MVEDEQGDASGRSDEPPRRATSTSESAEESVTRGRASATPFVLLGGTAIVIWAIVALVAGVVLVVWWLS